MKQYVYFVRASFTTVSEAKKEIQPHVIQMEWWTKKRIDSLEDIEEISDHINNEFNTNNTTVDFFTFLRDEGDSDELF